jgi:hypothetical protein
MGDISTNPKVVEIARGLVSEGRHVTRVQTGNRQAVVDAGWAARQAGQLLGRPVLVTTTLTDEAGGGLVVTAVFADADATTAGR